MTSELWQEIQKFGVTNLSRELGISRQAVHHWKLRERIPPEHFMSLDRALPMATDKIALAIWPDS